jgi:mono/diheme cytochrome c family protein
MMSPFVRRIGYTLGGVVGVVVLVAAGGYVTSESKLNAKLQIASEKLTIPADPASVARGQHLAMAISKCTECHGADLGGRVVMDNPAMGHWAAPNLTKGKGSPSAAFTDDDFVRAIRHGVAPGGRKLLMMPSSEYVNLTAEDLGAIIAYVKSVPAVERESTPSTLGPVARGLLVSGKLPILQADIIDHAQAPTPDQVVSPRAEYGSYITKVGGCVGCHGPTLAGGKVEMGDPKWPPAANITPTGLQKQAYTEAGFFTALRTGKRPDGTTINPAMPYRATKNMTDDEIRAVWLYLQTVTPREFGAR